MGTFKLQTAYAYIYSLNETGRRGDKATRSELYHITLEKMSSLMFVNYEIRAEGYTQTVLNNLVKPTTTYLALMQDTLSPLETEDIEDHSYKSQFTPKNDSLSKKPRLWGDKKQEEYFAANNRGNEFLPLLFKLTKRSGLIVDDYTSGILSRYTRNGYGGVQLYNHQPRNKVSWLGNAIETGLKTFDVILHYNSLGGVANIHILQYLGFVSPQALEESNLLNLEKGKPRGQEMLQWNGQTIV